jgi:hypothetical protein
LNEQRAWKRKPRGRLSGTSLECSSAMSLPHHEQNEKLFETIQPQ